MSDIARSPDPEPAHGHHPVPSDDELKERLSPEQYKVTQRAGTEQAFTGEYWDTFDPGMYRCIVCDKPLFDSSTKFDAGCGWPSFYQPIEASALAERPDDKFGMTRTEVVCSNCGAHLGHVFPDALDQPTGLRYCMNSCALRLERDEPSDSA